MKSYLVGKQCESIKNNHRERFDRIRALLLHSFLVKIYLMNVKSHLFSTVRSLIIMLSSCVCFSYYTYVREFFCSSSCER